jgi:hypothetical protein
LVAALSLATDLGTGVPLEQALRTCLLAIRLADDLGLRPAELRSTYYLALLRAIGCSATAYDLVDLFGDDLGLSGWQGTGDLVDPRQMLPILLRHVGRDQPPARRAAMLLHLFANMPRMPRVSLPTARWRASSPLPSDWARMCKPCSPRSTSAGTARATQGWCGARLAQGSSWMTDKRGTPIATRSGGPNGHDFPCNGTFVWRCR